MYVASQRTHMPPVLRCSLLTVEASTGQVLHRLVQLGRRRRILSPRGNGLRTQLLCHLAVQPEGWSCFSLTGSGMRSLVWCFAVETSNLTLGYSRFLTWRRSTSVTPRLLQRRTCCIRSASRQLVQVCSPRAPASRARSDLLRGVCLVEGWGLRGIRHYPARGGSGPLSGLE